MAYTNSQLVDCIKKSPNHSGLRTHSIDRITPHCVVGQLSAESIGNCFSPGREASCNYGIGYDGRVCLVVDESNRSWCSASRENDQRAITIECASDKSDPYAFTDACYQKLVELCADICKRNGKSVLLWIEDKYEALSYNPQSNEMILTVHRWFSNKTCPGDWLYSRLGDLASAVTAKLSNVPTWKRNSIGWWYEYPDGAYITDAWKWINGYWYRFGPTGYMLTGWQYVNEKWYYMDSSGHMLTGWQLVDGKWYYLYEDGHMASGETTPDGCYVNNSGVWEKPEWKAKTKWWYRHADGSYSKNTFEQINGKWYYFDAEGYMVTGWQYINEKWYYFYEDGHMAADETTPDGYTVDGSGVWEKP